MPHHHLIIGYGYLGRYLLKQLDPDYCWITNRSAVNLEYSNKAMLLDCNEAASWTVLSTLVDIKDLIVYFMLPPSSIDLAFFPKFIQSLDKLNIKHRILVSSTVVYGKEERIVDSKSDILIDSPRAERQFQIEQHWLNGIKTRRIVRLAGIYGPGRIIGKSSLLQGDQLSGKPNAWLNLIHVEDAARLLKRIGELEKIQPIVLGSDGTPVKRAEYYSYLARRLKQQSPQFDESEQSRGPGRRCNNRATRENCDWKPLYRSYKEGLDGLLENN